MSTERRRSWLPWVLLFLLLAAVLYATDRHARSVAETRADSATALAQEARAAVDSLKQIEASLRELYRTDTVTLTRWRTRWDSIVGPGRTDTLTVGQVIGVADSTIRACTAVVQTCEQRVAVATERGDSAEREAAHWQEAATQWRKVARGPLIILAVEGTVTTGLEPQGAGEITLGRGKLKVLGRIEVGQGAETCAILPNTDAYSCSTPIESTVRLGALWVF
jgi:hypothetical protein